MRTVSLAFQVFFSLPEDDSYNLCSPVAGCKDPPMQTLSFSVIRAAALIISLATTILTVTACVPTIAGGGAGFSVAYVAGELQGQEDLSIDEAWPAVIRALENLELRVKEQDKDSLSAKAVAYGADDKKVIVRLRRESAGTTSFKIRVGFWGDQAFSVTILDKIEEEAGLGTVPVGKKAPHIPAERRPLPADGPAPAERESLY